MLGIAQILQLLFDFVGSFLKIVQLIFGSYLMKNARFSIINLTARFSFMEACI